MDLCLVLWVGCVLCILCPEGVFVGEEQGLGAGLGTWNRVVFGPAGIWPREAVFGAVEVWSLELVLRTIVIVWSWEVVVRLVKVMMNVLEWVRLQISYGAWSGGHARTLCAFLGIRTWKCSLRRSL